jgi:integrase
MAHIRVRKETNRLYFDFTFQGLRCREQTALDNTPANVKRLAKMLDRIKAEILLGQFNYSQHFPNSKMLVKFEKKAAVIQQHLNGTPTFTEFSNLWFAEVSVAWRKSYNITINFILQNRLIPFFGEKDIGQIQKADLMLFRTQLTKLTGKKDNKFSADYINRHMKVLRMILNEAADRYNFTTPYRNIKLLKKDKRDIEPFSLDEVNKIITTVRDDFKSYYVVRFFTGMRTGEIHGLKWRYVDFDRRLILIRECWLKGEVSYTKTDGSQREIKMSQPVYDALKLQYEQTKNNTYVFVTGIGNPLADNVNKRVWHPLLRLLGLRARSPYQTRHTAATLWLASGENPEWIARQMGHSNTEMLFRVYSRYVPNLTRQDGSAFERLISEKGTK